MIKIKKSVSVPCKMALVTQHYTSFTRPVITYVTTETAV
ncbi:hypothetical protein SPC_0117 [Salmonella enterica subsp. enterica serovar Paratyphi C str. RKS4594]|uniref:Uncharacterized protein n=1 Tax=Salmonella paratyphi C (strain RKS4594) TaxID=476213 RepID=C0Q5G6_SALPC|nr:hypothetical protein SPC_0117 [Salmonella enterica subsp. enterica serovar Paratyphi C str. RKS4594]